MGDGNTIGDSAFESKPVHLAEDGEFYNPLIDEYSRSVVTVDLNHYEIHNGDHFFINE